MKHDVSTGGTTIAPERPRTADKPVSGKPSADHQEIQKKVEAAATPGPAHKALDALVGSWKAEVKCWMEPGQPPHVSQGTAQAKWILNGRFLEEEFRGEMMGKPLTGRSLMGYDNTKQTFSTVWISDMQTSMFTSEGRGENGNKIITLQGKASCAATDRKEVPMKSVFRVLGPDKHVFEMYDESLGQNAKTMEITYTRQ